MASDSWASLDKIDQKIIDILNKNARTSSKEIATELKKEGHDISDRTIRKRIERLEKSGIIKGYKAVLSDIAETIESEAIFLKLKVTSSRESLQEVIKEFVVALQNHLFVATLEGEWNMMIVLKVEDSTKNTSSRLVEKFSEHIIDYRISNFQIKDINILNMSLLLL
jgi:DNA-binding Lrp family transcriptional regulator